MLKTPEEFINYYYDILQQQMANNNIQISKLGFIGYMLHILGFTQYDVKQYYDNLFKEAFPVTSTDYQNLLFHSSLYGYIPPMANAANLVGTFEFLLAGLPLKQTNVFRRIILLKDIKLSIDNLTYNLQSKYKLIDNKSFYICNITKSDNSIESYNVSLFNPTTPLVNFKQEITQEYTFKLPIYQFGYYYTKSFPIDADFVSNVEVYVDGELYDIEYVKNFKSSNDNVVFLRYLQNSLILEFGSGIHGAYVPNKDVVVKISLTKGATGNIGSNTYAPSTGVIEVIDEDVNGQIVSSISYNANNFLKINVIRGEGGVNLLDSDSLRSELIKVIQTRHNLVSERDFYNIYSSYLQDFELLFKKTSIVDNNINLYSALYNNYMVPFYTNTLSVIECTDTTTCVDPLYVDSTSLNLEAVFPHPNNLHTINFEDTLTPYALYPSFKVNNIPYVSPFLYLYNNTLKTFKGYLFYEKFDKYFDKIIYNTDKSSGIPVSFSFEFDDQLSKLKFVFKSYQSLDDYIIKLTIDKFNICDQILIRINENRYEIEIPFFVSPIDIQCNLYNKTTNLLLYTYFSFNVTPCLDIHDYLLLNKYYDYMSNIRYYLHIPVIYTTQFNNNKTYILNKFNQLFSNIIYPGNRMITDSLKPQLFNTSFVSKEYLSLITKQKHFMDIRLPLRIFIYLYAKPNVFFDDFNAEIDKFKLDLANLLKTKYTGSIISFYKTQIVDFIHNMNWVKHCDVVITDNTGIAIPNSDIETYSLTEQMDILDTYDKTMALNFTPVFWYWGLNDIKVEVYWS